jgi:hypothetical protein
MSLSSPTLSVQKIGPDGAGSITNLASALQSVGASGDAFALQGKEFLIYKNGDSASHTVTIVAQADNFGNQLSGNNIAVVIPADDLALIGPLSRVKFADGNGLCQITYDAEPSTLLVGLFGASVTA